MEYTKLQRSFQNTPRWALASCQARGAWASLAGFCAETENGGVIASARRFTNAEWRNLTRCSTKDIEAAIGAQLCTWEGDNLCVEGYDFHGEGVCKLRRQHAKTGGHASGTTRRAVRREANASPSDEANAKQMLRHDDEANASTSGRFSAEPSTSTSTSTRGEGDSPQPPKPPTDWLPEDDPAPRKPVTVVRDTRPVITSCIPELRFEGAVINREDPAENWQFLVEQTSVAAVIAALKRLKTENKPGYYRHVQPLTRGTSQAPLAIIDGKVVTRYVEIDGVKHPVFAS